ncbi:MAG: hypothetical protein ABWX76_14600 [Leifsonia flava]
MPTRSTTRRVVIGASLAAAILGAGFWWVSGGDPIRGVQEIIEPRSTLTAKEIASGLENDPQLPVTNPEDVTATVCSPDLPCIEAVRAHELVIYRFDNQEDAAAFTTTLGVNGYQSDWIVLEYQNAALDTDRADSSYATVVDSIWTTK